MKSKIWMLIAVLGMAICASCSDDEPKTEPKGDEPTLDPLGPEEGDPDVEDEDAVIAEIAKLMNLTGKAWEGKYVFEKDVLWPGYEDVRISFKKNAGNVGVGTGTMIVRTDSEEPRYRFNYRITKDKRIVCKAVKTNWAGSVISDTIDMTFEYQDGLLRLDAPERAPVLLGKNNKVYSDINGIFYRSAELLCKVWLHENGLNILDFSSLSDVRVIQLVEPGSEEYNYYDTLRLDASTWEEDRESIILFDGYCGSLYWYIEDLTPERMVLKGLWDDYEDVYYVTSRDILPPPPPLPDSSKDPFSSNLGAVYLDDHAEWGVGGKEKSR